jgi:serine/threonine protein phosphatase PrpC
MSKTTCWNLRVSAEANQGGRKYMEDVTAVHFERVNSVEFASFAIFDGHGGREASHFAKVSDFLVCLLISLMRLGSSDGIYQKRKGIFFDEMRTSQKSHPSWISGLSRSNGQKTT